MPWQFIISLTVTILIGAVGTYQTYLTRLQLKLQLDGLNSVKKRKVVEITMPWRYKYGLTLAMVVLAASCWIPYFLSPRTIKVSKLRVSYGVLPKVPNASYMRVDGDQLSDFKNDFRIAFVCFHDLGNGDVSDSEGLQKSPVYDISDGQITMIVHWDSQFMNQFRNGASGTNYNLLLIPKKVELSQFSTLRQAYALGVQNAFYGAGPP